MSIQHIQHFSRPKHDAFDKYPSTIYVCLNSLCQQKIALFLNMLRATMIEHNKLYDTGNESRRQVLLLLVRDGQWN